MFQLISKSYCNHKWGPAAHHSKAIKEARLVERKACFILDAGNQGWGVGEVGLLSKGRLPPTDYQWRSTFRDGERGLHVETAQSALRIILKLVMLWSDQYHLDCFKYS